MLWLTSAETSEMIGVPIHRIALIERKSGAEGHVVAIFLDTGKEVRVIESLDRIRQLLDAVPH